jgi:hypothetical protein
MRKKIIQIVSILLLASVLLPTSAFGQNGAISPSIGVTPAKVVQTVSPGKATDITIKLHNYGRDPLPLSGSLSDFQDDNGNGLPVFTDRVTPRSARNWLNVTKTDLILDPGQTQEVAVKVMPPADAVPGGYHAAVMFQAHLPSYYFDLDANARILPAISVLFFLTIEGDSVPTVSDLSIQKLQVPGLVVSSPVSVIGSVSNPSNFFIQADAEASIKNRFGSSQKTDQLGQLIILPTGERKIVSAFTDRLVPGIYTASVQLKQGDKVLVASARFVSIPWQYIVGLVILLLVALGVAGRRRLKRAYAVLAGEEIQHHRRQRPIIR